MVKSWRNVDEYEIMDMVMVMVPGGKRLPCLEPLRILGSEN